MGDTLGFILRFIAEEIIFRIVQAGLQALLMLLRALCRACQGVMGQSEPHNG